MHFDYLTAAKSAASPSRLQISALVQIRQSTQAAFRILFVQSSSVISAHINALVFFHHVQCILRGIQVTGNLRTPAVRSCLRAAARQTANRARE
jgi:hypothetical protein